MSEFSGPEFERPLWELENKIKEKESAGSPAEELASLKKEHQNLCEKTFKNLSAWQRVQLARHPQRPYTLDYISFLIQDFVELHGDRRFSDDPAIVAGVGRFEGSPVAVVGHQKGRTTEENIHRRFGMPHPEGYRKALRLFSLAEKFEMPVITFVDTPGAYPGAEAEERGQAWAISENLMHMAQLPVATVACVIGEGGSGGALAISLADRILAMENSTYSVISPEGCASILFRDASRAEEAAEALRLTAKDLSEFGVADEVVGEPLGGAHKNGELAAKNLAKAISKHLKELRAIPADELLERRHEKYAKIGRFTEV